MISDENGLDILQLLPVLRVAFIHCNLNGHLSAQFTNEFGRQSTEKWHVEILQLILVNLTNSAVILFCKPKYKLF